MDQCCSKVDSLLLSLADEYSISTKAAGQSIIDLSDLHKGVEKVDDYMVQKKCCFLCDAQGYAVKNQWRNVHKYFCQCERNLKFGRTKVHCPLCFTQRKRVLFSSLQTFLRHKKVHTHPFNCPWCGLQFSSTRALKFHFCKSKRRQCIYCDRVFMNASLCRTHMRKCCSTLATHPFFSSSNNELIKRRPGHEFELNYSIVSCLQYAAEHVVEDNMLCCSVCGLNVCRTRLADHMHMHSTRPHMCSVCQRCFRRKMELKKHAKSHVSKPEFPYQCSICFMRFRSQYGYTRHKANHFLAKLYACSVCDALFTTASNRMRHERLHETAAKNNQVIKCNDCHKRFFNYSKYRQHMSSAHSTDVAFKCEQCEKEFKSLAKVRLHIQMDHYVHVFTCMFCQKFFTSFSYLARHVPNQHSDKLPPNLLDHEDDLRNFIGECMVKRVPAVKAKDLVAASEIQEDFSVDHDSASCSSDLSSPDSANKKRFYRKISPRPPVN